MTITISDQAFLELLQETFESSQHPNTDSFDVIWKYPQPLGQGYIRQLQLREGLTLEIIDYRLHDRLLIELHPLLPYGLFPTTRPRNSPSVMKRCSP